MEDVVFLNNGMNSDSDPSIQPNNTYTYGSNGNLISNGGNKYTYESVKGTSVSFSLPSYSNLSRIKYPLIPCGFITLGNKLTVFSVSEDGECQIGLVSFTDAGVGTYKIKYHNADLGFSLDHMIKGFGIVENDAYHRVYFNDNYNQPRTINLASKILNTYLNPFTTPLIDGEQYMVLSLDGTSGINHGLFYGIGGANGNVFTYDSTVGISAVGTINVSYFLIKYIDPTLFDYTPARQMATIDYFRTSYIQGAGSLKTGVNQYCYRVYTADGYYSPWSPLSNFIHITDTYNTNVSYQAYQGASNTNSTKAVTLKISNIPTAFDKIQVGVFESWSSVNGNPDNHVDASYVWYDDVITGSEMIVTHKGQENLETLLTSDIAFADAFVLKAKDIVSIKQRQILLNLTEREELTDYNPTATISGKLYTVPTDTSGKLTTGYKFGHNWNNSSGIASGSLIYGGKYVVRKKDSNVGACSLVYDGVTRNEGDWFYAKEGIPNYSAVNNAILKACIVIQEYQKADGTYVYRIIDLNDEYFDYKSPAVQMNLKGYWREETYRLAALIYDKFGVPFGVKYLGDFTTPSQAIGGWNLTTCSNDRNIVTLNLLSLVVSELDITDIKDRIGGISIVRCERDKTILAQGLTNKIIEKDGEAGTYVPLAFYQNADRDFNEVEGNIVQHDIATFISPETDFDYGVLNSSGPIAGDKLKNVADFRRANAAKQDDGNAGEQIYDKFVVWNAPPALERNIQGMHYFANGAEATLNFNSSFYFKNYDIPATENWPSGTNLRCGVGGKKLLIKTDGWIHHSMVVNYVRPKASSALYGGTSDQAKANNVYMGTGHFLRIDDAVLSNIYDPATQRYKLNGMQVFGGDCFVNLYDRLMVQRSAPYESPGASVYNYRGTGSLDPCDGSWAYTVIFPCESEINVALREDKHASLNGMSTTGSLGNANSGNVEDFNYNEAYSSANIRVPYTMLPVDYVSLSRFPYMARWSELKVLGQKVDGMRRFLQLNFKNVDALHGELTTGLVGADRLFYLQERGVGYFPIEERELSTSQIGAPIQLGVGGVMNRADNVDKFYGCQHKFSPYIGDDHFGWFDFRRKTFLMMTFNGGVRDVSTLMGMNDHFQNAFAAIANNPTGLYNTEKPLRNMGIVGVFDARHRMGLMTFLYNSGEEKLGFTIGVNTSLKAFIGFFSFKPALYIEHNNRLISSGFNVPYPIQPNTSYKVGNVISGSGNILNHFNYVCLQDYTTGAQPASAQSDTTHWYRIPESKTSVWKYWDGDICKFFGVTYPYELEVIFNGAVTNQANDTLSEKVFDNIEVYGNDTALTDVYYADSKRTASDLNIDALNKDFKLIDNSWWFSVALSNLKERMLDHYLRMKVVVKNYKNNPTVSLNKVKRIVYLKTVYRKK
jgi:hypothetical protein